MLQSGVYAPGTQQPFGASVHVAPVHTQIAVFFRDLRTFLGVTQPQAASHLATHAQVIDALENADVRYLPPWPETARIVMAYAAWARIDGRPILGALAALQNGSVPRRPLPGRNAAAYAHLQQSVGRLRQAGVVLVEGAKRLPQEAINQARERPARTFYAVSLPMCLVLLMLNTSTLQGALNLAGGPLAKFATSLRETMAVQFAPVREGLRWIEVEDPRSRRSDRLTPGGR
jgi:hypothetical protein